MVFNLCAAFLQMLSMCDWKVSLLSKNISNNFSQVLLRFVDFLLLCSLLC